jgi:hypothetical protein
MPFQNLKVAGRPASKKDESAEAAKKAGQGRFAVPAGPKLAVSNDE